MIASNLGQIVGRLLYGEHAPVEQPAKTIARHGERQAQVKALLAERGGVRCRDVAAALGIKASYASVLLWQMHKAGQIARNGVAKDYVYCAIGAA